MIFCRFSRNSGVTSSIHRQLVQSLKIRFSNIGHLPFVDKLISSTAGSQATELLEDVIQRFWYEIQAG
jgi:hypothetical protein